EDVQAVIRPVLEHRILLDHMAKLEGATPGDVVERLLTEIPAQDKPLPHSLAAAKIH
ncbi:AAA family ATPase, partial [Akkermansia muciniphila]|nr:AAA family ATPase [Akkermansia muciniphila]